MNIRQERFIDEYIISGNATEAARRAGYSARSAYSIGERLLKKDEVRREVSGRLEAVKTEKVCQVQEVLEHLSAVIRGQVKETRISANGRKFTVEVSEADKLAAADKLLRVAGAYRDKVEVKMSAAEQFIAALEQADEIIAENG